VRDLLAPTIKSLDVAEEITAGAKLVFFLKSKKGENAQLFVETVRKVCTGQIEGYEGLIDTYEDLGIVRKFSSANFYEELTTNKDKIVFYSLKIVSHLKPLDN